MSKTSVPKLEMLRVTELGYSSIQIWIQAAILGWKVKEFPVPMIHLDEHRSFEVCLDQTCRRRNYHFEVIKRELENPIANFGALQLADLDL